MEIISVIDELEREIQGAKKMPLTTKLLIEEELLYKYVDALRAHIPEDIRQAQWIGKEKERLLKDAKEEAKKIVNSTENKMIEMCDEKEVIKLANQKAKEIVDNANQKAAKIVQGSYEYVDERMSELEKRLDKQIKEIRVGKTEIKSTINKYKMKQTGAVTAVQANALNLKEKEVPFEIDNEKSEVKVINIKRDNKENF